ncbi:MAG: M16 family metallopeptidase [Dongiaceae bacterium]
MNFSAFRTRTLAALAVLIIGSAGLAQAKVFDPRTFTLANGLQVVVVENRRAPVVTHMVWYRCGAADEKPGKTGIAHFLEHLMFKGTKTMPPGAFSAEVARYGGDENAFTASDYTAYFQSVAVERLEDVMRLEADRMANLVLTDKEVLPERDVILEERRQRTDNEPGARLSEMMRASLFLNHPYRMPIIGWEHEMRGLTTEDALDWYGHWYAPNNAILIIAGDVTLEQVRPLAEKYYGVIAKRDVPVRNRPQEPAQFAPRRVTLASADVKQGQWSRQYQAPSYRTGPKEDVYALELLAEILGGNTSSRLYRRLVVDDRIAASAGAYFDSDAYDLGTFGFYAVPPPGTDAATVEKVTDEEIARLLREGVTEPELAAAKKALLSDAIKARDSIAGPARIIGTSLSTGSTIEDIEEWPDRIQAVTADQVKIAAAKVLQINYSVTGTLLPSGGAQ